MTFRLTIDGPRWERGLRDVVDHQPGLVPVIKGNGYGFGAGLLAERCVALGARTVAVGTPADLAAVRTVFHGEVLVMSPLGLAELADGECRAALWQDGVLRSVARAEVLIRLAELGEPSAPGRRPRVVLELDSPVHRHGIPLADLPRLAPALRRVPLAGAALHLPTGGDRRAATESVRRALAALREAGVPPQTLWVSHLKPAELGRLRAQEPGLRIRLRVGTGLWLADRHAFSASGTVLDAHPVPRHEAIGYRQRRSAAGTLIVVSGGTAHGVGLRASAAHGRWRDLARAAVAGAAHGAGVSPSPFHWAGRRLRYADVPHMQVSMLHVPAGTAPPAVGDQLACDLRMTVATFDEIEVSTAQNRAPGNSWAA